MNPGFRGVVAFLGGGLVMAAILDDGVRQRPVVAMLAITALLGLGCLWHRRARCARWVGRHALGYADSVAHRRLAVEHWRLIDAGDRDIRDIWDIERFANGR